ncbi:MAG: MBL fold metallo-hydrolase [Steroidobacteraceae bacterium]
MQPAIEAFFDEGTSTFSYLVQDPEARIAAVIDPVLDFEPRSGRVSSGSADRIGAALTRQQLTLEWILETHAHADHLSAGAYLRDRHGGRIAIGEGIRDVQKVFAALFNLGADFPCDGSQFDCLWRDGETFRIGALDARVIATPGHTSDSVTYLIGDAAFVGDTLFQPDYGSARCDFPGGDAGALFDSVQKLYTLPDDTRLFMCHDYPPQGRGPQYWTTVGVQKRSNVHLNAATRREPFVAMRTARDATLASPVLFLPALQVNIRAGRLPEPESNGRVYLKIPVNAPGSAAKA